MNCCGSEGDTNTRYLKENWRHLWDECADANGG